jgi:hypothetical protein
MQDFTERSVLIFDDECSACSSIAQLMRAKSPNIVLLSIYSVEARRRLLEFFPRGWVFRPYLIQPTPKAEKLIFGPHLLLVVAAMLGPVGIVEAGRAWLSKQRRIRQHKEWMVDPKVKMRAYLVESIAAAEAISNEKLILPKSTNPFVLERIIHFYNMLGAIQTSTYWTHEDKRLTIEQAHRSIPPPMTGNSHQSATLTIGNGLEAEYFDLTDITDNIPILVLIVPVKNEQWLYLRGKGLNKLAFQSMAASLSFDCVKEAN